MGREVRRVAPDWEHPAANGRYIPLYGELFLQAWTAWEIGRRHWIKGEREDFETGQWKPHDATYSYDEWDGGPPREVNYMPPEAFGEWFMMYETTSEGTPISPAFPTPEKLAEYLYETGASAFAGMTATYDQWLRVARGGYAPSAVVQGSVLKSGVEGFVEP